MGVSIDTAQAAALPENFTAALDGGENFLKRLGLLQQAKQDADDAVAALKLGATVAAAHAALEQKRAEAEKTAADLKAQAEAALAQAQAQAQAIITDANAKAQAIINDADAAKASSEAAATATRKAAAEWEAGIRAKYGKIIELASQIG